MSILSVKGTMALVAKHTLVADKVTVEVWVQIPPQHVGLTQQWPGRHNTWGETKGNQPATDSDLDGIRQRMKTNKESWLATDRGWSGTKPGANPKKVS